MATPIPLTAEWTTWDNTERAEVISWHDAKALVDRIGLSVKPPCIVEFYAPHSGLSLGVGLGRKDTIITYQASLEPPYFISLGEEGRSGKTWFCYGKEQTEYLAKNLVPLDQGLAALRHFIEDRTQPENVGWERL